MWTEWFLGFLGLTSGMAVAGGMFALLIALGVVVRFAGKTHTARAVMQYEDAAALAEFWEISSVSISFICRLEFREQQFLDFCPEFLPEPGPWPLRRLWMRFLFSAGESA